MNLTFGLTKIRETKETTSSKEEKRLFEDAYMTMEAKSFEETLGKKVVVRGAKSTFNLCNKAKELLNLPLGGKVSFGEVKSEDGTTSYYLVNTTTLELKGKQFPVNTKDNFKDKTHYNILAEVFNLDIFEDSYFKCTKVEGEELPTVKIDLIVKENDEFNIPELTEAFIEEEEVVVATIDEESL